MASKWYDRNGSNPYYTNGKVKGKTFDLFALAEPKTEVKTVELDSKQLVKQVADSLANSVTEYLYQLQQKGIRLTMGDKAIKLVKGGA